VSKKSKGIGINWIGLVDIYLFVVRQNCDNRRSAKSGRKSELFVGKRVGLKTKKADPAAIFD
jgi:hypothetical protein